MNIIAWIVLGLIAGAIAKALLPRVQGRPHKEHLGNANISGKECGKLRLQLVDQFIPAE